MEIEPQKMNIRKLEKMRTGKFVDIDDDVNNVASDLKAIDPNIHLRWSEGAEHFVIYYRKDGKDKLITTAKELDQRVVNLIRKIGSDDYNFGEEVEKQDIEAKKASERLQLEILSERAQRLAHALRKDRGYDKGTIFVPKGF